MPTPVPVLVHLTVPQPEPDTQPRPAKGHLDVTLLKRTTSGNTVYLPTHFDPVLLDPEGRATLYLYPTPPDSAYRIAEHVPGGISRTVQVLATPPTDPPTPINYADLPDIDPTSLLPQTPTIPAWQNAIDTITALLQGATPPNPTDPTGLSSGGSVHLGEGPPPTVIPGARLKDIYIDTLTNNLYELT